MYYNFMIIKRILGRQYNSKGTKNKEQLKKEIETLLPNGFIVLINPSNGYLYVTRT
jgi:hypothetical protein